MEVQVHQDVRAAFFELIAGQADALVYPQPVLLSLSRQVGVEDRIKVVGEPLMEVRRGIRVMKDDVDLHAMLNKAVALSIGPQAEPGARGNHRRAEACRAAARGTADSATCHHGQRRRRHHHHR